MTRNMKDFVYNLVPSTNIILSDKARAYAREIASDVCHLLYGDTENEKVTVDSLVLNYSIEKLKMARYYLKNNIKVEVQPFE